MDKNKIASMIDHTILKPEATSDMVKKLCSEALEYSFASVCVNPSFVRLSSELLKDSVVKVCTVIGFPLGASTSAVKAFEAKDAIENGAQEVDMVINIGKLKEKEYDYVKTDIEAVVKAAKGRAITKVIIETSLLSNEEKIIACRLAVEAGADFVKTSTGFSTGGATVSDIKLMRETVGEKVGVKASGGVKTLEAAEAVIQVGATRIGTSSSVAICEGYKSDEGY